MGRLGCELEKERKRGKGQLQGRLSQGSLASGSDGGRQAAHKDGGVFIEVDSSERGLILSLSIDLDN